MLLTSCSKEESLNSSNNSESNSQLKAGYVGCPECPITLWGVKTALAGLYPPGSHYCPGDKSVVCHKIIDVSDIEPSDNTVRVDVYSSGTVQYSITGDLTSYTTTPFAMDLNTSVGAGLVQLRGDNLYDYQ